MICLSCSRDIGLVGFPPPSLAMRQAARSVDGRVEEGELADTIQPPRIGSSLTSGNGVTLPVGKLLLARGKLTRGGSHRGGESNERGRPTLALFSRPNRPTFFTRFRNCRTTVEGSARRDARLRQMVDCGEPFSRRYTTPSICIRCMDAGTRAIPSPTATKPRLDVTRGARWTTRGLNPEARHAAIVAS